MLLTAGLLATAARGQTTSDRPAPPPSLDEAAQLPPVPDQGGQLPPSPADAATEPARDASSGHSLRMSLEATGVVVAPAPGAQGSSRSGRASLDAVLDLARDSPLSLSLSGRFNLQDDARLVRATADLREAYATIRAGSRTIVQAGRVNIRNGIALGFSPVDFLRRNSAIDTASPDPTAVRAGRLGAVMARVRHEFSSATVALLWAPELGGVQTNDRGRWLLALDLTAIPASPQIQVLRDGDRTVAGISGSVAASNSVVLYGEVAAGSLPSLAAEAAGRNDAAFRIQAAIGGSWANAAARVTVNLEYHYNGAGLTRQQLGAGTPALAAAARSANIRQEPLGRDQFFVRAQWQDVGVQGLNLAAFALLDATGDSALASGAATFELDDHWTFGIYVTSFVGKLKSVYGLSPVRRALTLQIKRYF